MCPSRTNSLVEDTVVLTLLLKPLALFRRDGTLRDIRGKSISIPGLRKIEHNEINPVDVYTRHRDLFPVSVLLSPVPSTPDRVGCVDGAPT